MSIIRFCSKVGLVSLLIVEIAIGFRHLLQAYNEIRPTQARCEAAFSRSVPSTPCENLQGLETVGATRPESFTTSNMDSIFIICFISGSAIAAVASGFLYGNNLKTLRKASWASASTIPSAFGGKVLHYLEYMTKTRYVQIFQTFAALVSILVWSVATLYHDDVDRMLHLFNPENTLEETQTIALWYTCGSHRLYLFAADLLIQGFVAFSLAIWVLSPVKPLPGDYRFAIVDLLQVTFVIWSLPIAIHWQNARAYNVYILTGVLRTLRIFDGVPELARHFRLLISESDPARFKDSGSTARKLLAGQFALAIKILFFLGGAALMLIGIEGWPCEYHIINKTPCECFPEFRTFEGTIYFVFTTMTTVGFGDLVPRTTLGRTAVIAVIATGVYLAPTWIGQIEKQHKHYVNAKRAEQNSQALAKSQSLVQIAAARSVENTSATQLGDNKLDSQTPKLPKQLGFLSSTETLVPPPASDKRPTLVESVDEPLISSGRKLLSGRELPAMPPVTLSDARDRAEDLVDPAPVADDLLPLPTSPVAQRDPLTAQGSFKNTVGSFAKRLGSSKITEASPKPSALSTLQSVPAVGRPEWAAALKMLRKQQDQLSQQQALMQYLLDFTVQACASDAQKALLNEVLQTLRRMPQTG